jgi:uncharacterized membrane protein YczE
MMLNKRIPIYFTGIIILALGISLLNKSNLGTTPLSSIPYILSKILANKTVLTYGSLTLLFHTICILLQIIVWKKVSPKMILQLPLAVVFSALLDLFMAWIQVPDPSILLRVVLCALGISLSALGIVIIVNMDLMLPAPDAFPRALNAKTGVELYKVKIAGDVTWVVITSVISLIYIYQSGVTSAGTLLAGCFNGKLAVGVGTFFSMYFTGRLVGVFKKRLTFLELSHASANQIQ